MSADPVVVTPIPASQSRTLRLARWSTWGTVAAAALPTLVSTILDLLGNPIIAKLIADKVPVEYRGAIAIAVVILVQKFGHLRKVTVAPIAGTPAAEGALTLLNTRPLTQSASASTKENV